MQSIAELAPCCTWSANKPPADRFHTRQCKYSYSTISCMTSNTSPLQPMRSHLVCNLQAVISHLAPMYAANADAADAPSWLRNNQACLSGHVQHAIPRKSRCMNCCICTMQPSTYCSSKRTAATIIPPYALLNVRTHETVPRHLVQAVSRSPTPLKTHNLPP